MEQATDRIPIDTHCCYSLAYLQEGGTMYTPMFTYNHTYLGDGRTVHWHTYREVVLCTTHVHLQSYYLGDGRSFDPSTT